jgi:hypothetical protein
VQDLREFRRILVIRESGKTVLGEAETEMGATAVLLQESAEGFQGVNRGKCFIFFILEFASFGGNLAEYVLCVVFGELGIQVKCLDFRELSGNLRG